MSRLIDADAEREAFMEMVYEELADDPDNLRANRIIDCFDSMATVEAVPVVHGEWIKDGSWAKCSVCGEVIAYRDKSNFCKECGADMRKKV